MEKQIHTTFSDIYCINSSMKQKKVVLQLSQEYLCLRMPATVMHQTVTRVDHIHISRISKVSTKKGMFAKKNTKDLIISYDRNNATLYFRSKEVDRILQALDSIVQRLKQLDEIEKLKHTKAKTLTPSDVPGQLLNICFLNIEATNAKCRSAAYNLLSYMITRFNLPLTAIFESEGLYQLFQGCLEKL